MSLEQSWDWSGPSDDPHDEQFGDMIDQISVEDASEYDAVLVGEPYDGAVIGRGGANEGPAAIREALASTKTHHFDAGPVESVGDLGDIEIPDGTVSAVQTAVRDVTAEIHATDTIPVFLGGDNSLTYANVQPLLQLVQPDGGHLTDGGSDESDDGVGEVEHFDPTGGDEADSEEGDEDETGEEAADAEGSDADADGVGNGDDDEQGESESEDGDGDEDDAEESEDTDNDAEDGDGKDDDDEDDDSEDDGTESEDAETDAADQEAADEESTEETSTDEEATDEESPDDESGFGMTETVETTGTTETIETASGTTSSGSAGEESTETGSTETVETSESDDAGASSSSGTEATQRVGVISLDAHLDFRQVEAEPTSGTPYRQLLNEGLDALAVLGARHFETSTQYAAELREAGGEIVTAEEVGEDPIEAADRALDTVSEVEAVYVSVDMDVLDTTAAPGVSAPTPGGITSRELFRMVRLLASEDRLAGIEVVETAPPLCSDGRTAQAAARTIAHALAVAGEN